MGQHAIRILSRRTPFGKKAPLFSIPLLQRLFRRFLIFLFSFCFNASLRNPFASTSRTAKIGVVCVNGYKLPGTVKRAGEVSASQPLGECWFENIWAVQRIGHTLSLGFVLMLFGFCFFLLLCRCYVTHLRVPSTPPCSHGMVIFKGGYSQMALSIVVAQGGWLTGLHLGTGLEEIVGRQGRMGLSVEAHGRAHTPSF